MTEAGFGADLGAEKFIDITCRSAGLRPSAAVIVATVRALKHHGGASGDDLTKENLDALKAGLVNLERHITNVSDHYGVPAVVSINKFLTDTDAEIDLLRTHVESMNVPIVLATTGPMVESGLTSPPLSWRSVMPTSDRLTPDTIPSSTPTTPPCGKRSKLLPRRSTAHRKSPPIASSRPAPRVDDRGVRPPAGVHRQDPVFVLHRSVAARCTLGAFDEHSRGRLAAGEPSSSSYAGTS